MADYDEVVVVDDETPEVVARIKCAAPEVPHEPDNDAQA